ncbi:hypothetical protein [Amycolatopsis lurida]|uniref:hypothetical protein n=1 Tax=Amycolatopsis lurida TaxID=31959 RepID=UPI00366255B2
MFKRIAATLAIALGMGMGLTVPAQAATVVGGLSVEAACDTQWGAYTYATLVGIPPNAYSWRCRLNLGGQSSFFTVDLNRECRRVYGGNTWATPLNSSDPYSWRCWR